MAKNSVSDWDTTANNNADVAGISIAENATPPQNINNAMRAIMAQIKSFYDAVALKAGATFTGQVNVPALTSSTADGLIYLRQLGAQNHIDSYNQAATTETPLVVNSSRLDLDIAQVITARLTGNGLTIGAPSGIGGTPDPFSGNHLQMQVVIPNAAGGTNGTLWRHMEAFGGGVPVMLDFQNAAGVRSGYIAIGASSVTYSTTSDYRVKTNLAEISDESAIARSLSYHPLEYERIEQPGIVQRGYLAHEVQAVNAQAAQGEKDAVDEDGNPILQGVDLSKIVPDIHAALNAALRKIDRLEVEIEHLKGE